MDKNNYKTMTAVPAWLDALQVTDKINTENKLYELVPLVYRAVNIRCNALTAIPFHLYDKKNKEVEWDAVFKTPLKNLIWKTEASMLIKGEAFWLSLDANNKRLGAQWLNPYTMKMNVTQTNDGKLTITYTQTINGINPKTWPAEQITHFHEFSMQNDVGAGVAPATVAIEDGRTLRYISRFASVFFEHGVMPMTLIGVEGSPSQEDIDRFQNWFKRITTGIQHAFTATVLRGGFKVEKLTPDLDTLALTENRTAAVQNIAWAFGIPETMLTDAANYATATAQHRSFYEETVNPRADLLADGINSQFLKGTNYILKADPEEMSIFQEDEASRAGSLSQLVSSGIPLSLAMDLLGYELNEDQMAILEKEEAESKPELAPANNTPQGNELRKWEAKSIKSFKKGKGADVPFETELIDSKIQTDINSALKDVKTEADIKNVFRKVEPKQDANAELIEELRSIRLALLEGNE